MSQDRSESRPVKPGVAKQIREHLDAWDKKASGALKQLVTLCEQGQAPGASLPKVAEEVKAVVRSFTDATDQLTGLVNRQIHEGRIPQTLDPAPVRAYTAFFLGAARDQKTFTWVEHHDKLTAARDWSTDLKAFLPDLDPRKRRSGRPREYDEKADEKLVNDYHSLKMGPTEFARKRGLDPTEMEKTIDRVRKRRERRTRQGPQSDRSCQER
jgi:hypothetical protein